MNYVYGLIYSLTVIMILMMLSGCQPVQNDAQGAQPIVHVESVRKVGSNLRGTVVIGGTRIGF